MRRANITRVLRPRLAAVTFATLALALLGVACSGSSSLGAPHAGHAHGDHVGDRHHDGPHDDHGGGAPQDRALAEVAAVHGGAGPWAVAGYRMGMHALGVLGLARGSFDLEVVHHSPREVQYACVADGAAASTGASLGKLNLSIAESAAAETRTTYRKKSTGQVLTLRLTPGFVARFADVPRDRLAAAGRTVMTLPAAEVFQVAPAGPQ